MTEAFLYYIWQFQYFDKRLLKTAAGEPVSVLRPGILNQHAGPDFSGASIRIGEVAWSGTVEIHILSSDWNTHGHHTDAAYENVILHVVWENDKEILRTDGTPLPTLVLRNRVDETMVKNYRTLLHNPFTIPCTQSLPSVPSLLRHAMVDRALTQRLESKVEEVMTLLRANNNDWEETAWQLLSRNFGFKVNADAFLQLGRALPHRIMLRHTHKLQQIEALLFGQAGFLELPAGDDYYRELQQEFRLLERKYGLAEAKLARAQWRFLRLRPANFPTVRLAQFGALVQQQKKIFSRIIDAPSPKALVELFSVMQSDYWQHHYRFNKKAKGPVPELGRSSVQNILVNTVVPLLMAWGKFTDDQRFADRATDLLEFLPPENNVILREWSVLQWKPRHAFDAQGLIELYNAFCRRRICLNCVIGASLLKPGSKRDDSSSSDQPAGDL